ncbi:outer membrane protein assembly factor BamD [endosymbiont of Sipalinus gigas]|uniref:outer membrane protein assembly factor BamD n=1 Tax=endosymbiont of Sipalinus gigas TaxID=1972134 RepID=UPI000DC7079C|nr:outer membrane protein assembly factor BamD [endosymbiont of Sipalinus gigas]BBA85212.1 outer membrane protein assembly factor BamD [endosymbiont of Sipalinus gigas]
MKNILLITIYIMLNLNSCISSQNYNNKIKTDIFNNLINENYKLVIKDLKRTCNLCIPYKDLIETKIELAFSYYKVNKLEKSILIINKLLKYKELKNYDYLLYMKGLINILLHSKNKKSIFTFEENRDNSKLKIAFNSFKELIENYPNSVYYNSSIKKLNYIKDKIALNEILKIKYFLDNRYYLSSLNRSIEFIKNFQDTSLVYYAVIYARHSCEKLSLNEILKNFNKILDSNIDNFIKLKLIKK